jgi:hypothetical protein
LMSASDPKADLERAEIPQTADEIFTPLAR